MLELQNAVGTQRVEWIIPFQWLGKDFILYSTWSLGDLGFFLVLFFCWVQYCFMPATWVANFQKKHSFYTLAFSESVNDHNAFCVVPKSRIVSWVYGQRGVVHAVKLRMGFVEMGEPIIMRNIQNLWYWRAVIRERLNLNLTGQIERGLGGGGHLFQDRSHSVEIKVIKQDLKVSPSFWPLGRNNYFAISNEHHIQLCFFPHQCFKICFWYGSFFPSSDILKLWISESVHKMTKRARGHLQSSSIKAQWLKICKTSIGQ